MPVPQNLSLTLKAKLFRGLSDPSRLAIVEELRSGAKTVSEIVDATKLSQPNASAHLSCLRDCGLVASREEGRRVFYSLCEPRMDALIQTAEGIISAVAERISCCSNYECQSAKKCVSDQQCSSTARVSPASMKLLVVKIPHAEIRTAGELEK